MVGRVYITDAYSMELETNGKHVYTVVYNDRGLQDVAVTVIIW